MPVKCPECGLEFGDLEHRLREFYNAFDELVSEHQCPRCKTKFVAGGDEESES